jgi:hypothetical protein
MSVRTNQGEFNHETHERTRKAEGRRGKPET